MSLLIKNFLLEGRIVDVLIEANKIKQISQKSSAKAERVIDGTNKAIIPGLVNSHTHAAMTLLRGYGDDMNLMEWLQDKIWPIEAKLTAEDIYWGTKFACLEMIKTGTTCFHDMYWFPEAQHKAVEEMGMRAVLDYTFFDNNDKEKRKKVMEETPGIIQRLHTKNPRIKMALGPHAIYTVSKEGLQWAMRFATEKGLLVHFHLCETKSEVDDCIKTHGKKPIPLLEEWGFLQPNLITAHSVWLDDEDIQIMKKHDVKVVHNPTANMKLAIGKAFRFKQLQEAGLLIGLGTDGVASNNNLDMFEIMKIAALLQKFSYDDPTLLKAHEAFELATKNGYQILGIDAGTIEEGKLADLSLIDLDHPALIPLHNLASNIVYAGNGDCVDTVIIDGKVIMENRKVAGEEEIKKRFIKAVSRLT